MRKAILTLGLLLATLPAEAGVVVLKSGKVMVGEITEDTKDFIVLKYRKPQRGEFKVERHRVRWYDLKLDTLPDAYFAEHAEDKLDKAWEPLREKWRLSQRRPLDEVPPPSFDKELLATRKVEFPSKDGLTISADLYGESDKTRPFIVLCHQARSSRGEYAAIAPKLVKAGYSCLALDQRSGSASGKIINETASRAVKANKKGDYLSAQQDIEAAIGWVREQGFQGTLTLWGSSYSASLALLIGASNEQVKAVVAFSPGDYLEPKGSVAEAAATLEKPTLIVAPEKERAQAEALGEAIASAKKTVIIREGLLHGSRTLYVPRDTKETWDAVLGFLREHAR